MIEGIYLTKRRCPCDGCPGHIDECMNFQNVEQSNYCSICYMGRVCRFDTSLTFPLTPEEAHEMMNIEGGTKT